MLWDIFISHAHEDKTEVARPLAALLQEHELRVWLDETELRLGDSLKKKIEEGLALSTFGVVVLSESFFAKRWPVEELEALWQREDNRRKVLLPVWHRISKDRVAQFSPLLAGRFAVSTNDGLERVLSEILKAVGGSRKRSAQELTARYDDNFELNQTCLAEARMAISELALPTTWSELAADEDLSAEDTWMGSASPVVIQMLYRLYAPLACFRQMSYALNRSLSSFVSEAKIRYCLLSSAFYALTNEGQLASSGKAVQYSPRRPGWRRLRQTEPQRYLWQGISEERFDEALPFFINKGPVSGSCEVRSLEAFIDSYLSAFRSERRTQRPLGLLANALYNFQPKARPVYYRLLTFWDRVFLLYNEVTDHNIRSIDLVEEAFGSQAMDECPLSRVSGDDLFEPFDESWRATDNFWEVFVGPKLRATVAGQ